MRNDNQIQTGCEKAWNGRAVADRLDWFQQNAIKGLWCTSVLRVVSQNADAVCAESYIIGVVDMYMYVWNIYIYGSFGALNRLNSVNICIVQTLYLSVLPRVNIYHSITIAYCDTVRSLIVSSNWHVVSCWYSLQGWRLCTGTSDYNRSSSAVSASANFVSASAHSDIDWHRYVAYTVRQTEPKSAVR